MEETTAIGFLRSKLPHKASKYVDFGKIAKVMDEYLALKSQPPHVPESPPLPQVNPDSYRGADEFLKELGIDEKTVFTCMAGTFSIEVLLNKYASQFDSYRKPSASIVFPTDEEIEAIVESNTMLFNEYERIAHRSGLRKMRDLIKSLNK